MPTVLIGSAPDNKSAVGAGELGYHDNVEDADWLTGNLEEIAAALSGALQVFRPAIPDAVGPRTGIVA